MFYGIEQVSKVKLTFLILLLLFLFLPPLSRVFQIHQTKVNGDISLEMRFILFPVVLVTQVVILKSITYLGNGRWARAS